MLDGVDSSWSLHREPAGSQQNIEGSLNVRHPGGPSVKSEIWIGIDDVVFLELTSKIKFL